MKITLPSKLLNAVPKFTLVVSMSAIACNALAYGRYGSEAAATPISDCSTADRAGCTVLRLHGLFAYRPIMAFYSDMKGTLTAGGYAMPTVPVGKSGGGSFVCMDNLGDGNPTNGHPTPVFSLDGELLSCGQPSTDSGFTLKCPADTGWSWSAKNAAGKKCELYKGCGLTDPTYYTCSKT